MAFARLTAPSILVAISLALLFNVSSLNCADDQKNGPDGMKPQLDSEKVKAYHTSLFYDSLEPDQVLVKLTELMGLFRSHEVPSHQNSFKNQVEALIEMSQMDGRLCTASSVKTIRQQIDDNSERDSLRRYSIHWGESYLKQCGCTMFGEADENVKKISPVHKRDVHRLEAQYRVLLPARSLRLAHCTPSEHHDKLIGALKNFLLNKSINREVSLKRAYEEHVIGSCKVWLSATERTLTIDDYLFYKEDLCDEPGLTRRAHGYIGKAQICKYIDDNNEKIRKDLQLDQNEIMKVGPEAGEAMPFNGQMCTDELIKGFREPNKAYNENGKERKRRFLSVCFIDIGDEMQEKVEAMPDEHRSALEKLEELEKDSALSIAEMLKKSVESEENKKKEKKEENEEDEEKEKSEEKEESEEMKQIKEYKKQLIKMLKRYFRFRCGSKSVSLEKFQKHLSTPCNDWLSATERARRNLEHFFCFNILCDQEWTSLFYGNINKGHICKYIVYFEEEIKKKLLKQNILKSITRFRPLKKTT